MRIEFKIANQEIRKEIFPNIRFKLSIRNLDSSNQERNLILILATPTLTLNGNNISNSTPIIIGEIFKTNARIEINADFPLSRETIKAIESERIDDLPYSISLELLYSYANKDSITIFEKTTESISSKYSQKEWTIKLHEMGYTESWIFEITRAKIEGLDTVVEHLQKAADCYYTRDYDNCMANTRIAWDAFKPLIDSKWKKIAIMIDEGSEGQSTHDPKSQRIKEIIDKIHYLSNVGIHREGYKVFPEDAMLCYYLTVSMISYLSRWLNKVPVE